MFWHVFGWDWIHYVSTFALRMGRILVSLTSVVIAIPNKTKERSLYSQNLYGRGRYLGMGDAG